MRHGWAEDPGESMNEKGNLILIILAGFLVLAILIPVILYLFPPADLILRIILALMIFQSVKGYIGEGILTLILSGILIYILVIKYAYITAVFYIFFFVFLYLQVLSMLMWTLGMTIGKRH